MTSSVLRHSSRNKFFFNLFLFFCFSAIIGLSGLYIFLVNSEVKEKYALQECQNKLSEAIKENEKLEVSFLKENSLGNVMALLDGFGLEKTEKVSYIKLTGPQVVIK